MDIISWFISAEVLQTLFDGVLGAAVGAGVAVVVLRLTLKDQREALTAQMAKQDYHHREQLTVQRDENTRARLHDVAASILSSLTKGRETLEIDEIEERAAAVDEVSSQFGIDIERLHLDIPGNQEQIYYVIRDLVVKALYASRNPMAADAPTDENIDALYSWTGGLLVAWIRGSTTQRSNMIEAGKFSVRFILANGIDAWNQLSREQKMAGKPVPGRGPLKD